MDGGNGTGMKEGTCHDQRQVIGIEIKTLKNVQRKYSFSPLILLKSIPKMMYYTVNVHSSSMSHLNDKPIE